MEHNNNLFKATFNERIWGKKEDLEYLKAQLNTIENNIEKFLEGITYDFPNLTDHSIKHSQMLWNYANIIIGNQKKYLNPLEGFILHSCFLIHDSGMCYSILGNKKELEKDLIYLDYIKNREDTPDNREEALFYTVRSRHGDLALKIATEKLSNNEYLITDSFLREEFGLIIGKISKSHTCDIAYIDREFGPNYCCPKYPNWPIDLQKLSFILRTSDAAHIDNLRTPKTLKMISEIPGVSKEHWTFQKKIGFPILSKNNLLAYSTNSPFKVSEQKAWWFCYDALKVLDRELKNANEYFEIRGKNGFGAKGVKGIFDTLQLGKNYIRTEGWTSIDTTIKVSNPIHIASELGGIKLYQKISFALREILQNSIDAINFLRLFTNQNNLEVGLIKIKLQKEENDFNLIITDNGIGMSQTIMAKELLDFGGSYWKSNKFSWEYQGIKAKGFESIGKFGIGFFSIFMLGDKIDVTSWKYGESLKEIKTLSFYDGLNTNPILKNPDSNAIQELKNYGTTIKIKLNEDPYSKNGLIGNHKFNEPTLYNLVKHYIPSCNVKLEVIEQDYSINVLSPNSLENLSLSEFIQYIYIPTIDDYKVKAIQNYGCIGLNFFDLKSDSRYYGKLSLLPPSNPAINFLGLIISNGIHVSNLEGVVGYLVTDEIASIKRNAFKKFVPYDVMKNWAINQISFIENRGLIQLFSTAYLGLKMTFNLLDENFPIALMKINNNYFYISISGIKKHLELNNTITFYKKGIYESPANCDGFLYSSLSFNAALRIIRDEDEDKIISYIKLIEKSIKEVWGEFVIAEDINYLQQSITAPYSSKKTYKKPLN